MTTSGLLTAVPLHRPLELRVDMGTDDDMNGLLSVRMTATQDQED